MTLSFLAAAAAAADRTALVADGDEISFGELAPQVGAAVGWLRRHGAGGARGDEPVAVLGETCRQTLVWLYALFEIGVPAAPVDPRLPEAQRRLFVAGVGARLTVTAADAEALPVSEIPEDLAESPPGAAPTLPDDERPLAIVRTSGTSGPAKGVVLSRRAFAAAAAASARNLGWHDDDRWLLSLSVAHVGGLSILARCLAARRPVVVRRLRRFDAASVAEILDRDRVTLVSLVPTMLRRLLEIDAAPPPHLRAVLLGGAAAAPRLLAEAAGRGWPVLTTYGLTEACSQVATQRYVAAGRGAARRGPTPGVEPVEGMEVRIRQGAVEIRGSSLMSGYLPAGDALPFDADGWFTTGDLGRFDDAGRLHILGRRDDVIVTGGENVHPRQVEEVLEEHPAITAAGVFGIGDREWGEVVAAALVAPAPPDEAELARFLEDRLAPHQRPRRIVFVEALPSVAPGKLDRRRLKAQISAGSGEEPAGGQPR